MEEPTAGPGGGTAVSQQPCRAKSNLEEALQKSRELNATSEGAESEVTLLKQEKAALQKDNRALWAEVQALREENARLQSQDLMEDDGKDIQFLQQETARLRLQMEETSKEMLSSADRVRQLLDITVPAAQMHIDIAKQHGVRNTATLSTEIENLQQDASQKLEVIKQHCRCSLMQAKHAAIQAQKIQSEMSQLTERAELSNWVAKDLIELTAFEFKVVLADKLRTWPGGPLPHHQELEATLGPGALQTVKVSLQDVFSNSKLLKTILVVSHRWVAPGNPDPDGKQQAVVIDHVNNHPEILYVWEDWWCIPQGKRTEREQDYFSETLEHIYMLFFGCQVLIMLDMQYLGRFWTSYEAWLSMHAVGTKGFVAALGDERRFTIRALGAAKAMERSLIDTWGPATIEEAHAQLSEADILVTNSRDKEQQLKVLQGLSKDLPALCDLLAQLRVWNNFLGEASVLPVFKTNDQMHLCHGLFLVLHAKRPVTITQFRTLVGGQAVGKTSRIFHRPGQFPNGSVNEKEPDKWFLVQTSCVPKDGDGPFKKLFDDFELKLDTGWHSIYLHSKTNGTNFQSIKVDGLAGGHHAICCCHPYASASTPDVAQVVASDENLEVARGCNTNSPEPFKSCNSIAFGFVGDISYRLAVGSPEPVLEPVLEPVHGRAAVLPVFKTNDQMHVCHGLFLVLQAKRPVTITQFRTLVGGQAVGKTSRIFHRPGQFPNGSVNEKEPDKWFLVQTSCVPKDADGPFKKLFDDFELKLDTGWHSIYLHGETNGSNFQSIKVDGLAGGHHAICCCHPYASATTPDVAQVVASDENLEVARGCNTNSPEPFKSCNSNAFGFVGEIQYRL